MTVFFNKNNALSLVKLVSLLAISLPVYGCGGYQPLYGDVSLQDKLANVQVEKVVMDRLESTKPGSRRAAQLVTQRLYQAFDVYDNGSRLNSYFLSVILREGKATLAVRRDATEQRLQLHLNADVYLKDSADVKIFSTIVTASAPYNVEDTPYSTDAGRQKAKESAVKVLSEEIIQRISLFLHNNK